VIPMKQEGVLVRPLRQMNGHASFNEVFFTDARIERDWVVGSIGDGWAAALTTLAHERRFGAMGRPSYGTRQGRALDEARVEADRHFATYSWYPQRAGRVDLLAEQARANDVGADRLSRQDVAAVTAKQRVAGWTADRARAARALGRQPGAEGSIGKLAMSDIARDAARAHSRLGGADGMLRGSDGALDGLIAEILVSVPAQSIAGGTDEIQKNILGEKSLGLPREPSIDKDLPYNKTARNG